MSGEDRAHVDLLGMISGELAPAERSAALDHVQSCEQCRDELVAVVALVGELRDAGRHSPVDPSEVPPLRLPDRSVESGPVTLVPLGWEPPGPRRGDRDADAAGGWRPTRIRRLVSAVAVAVVALVVGVVIGHDGRQQVTTAAAPVRLAPVGSHPTPASGAAEMTGSGAGQIMAVTVSALSLPRPSDHYEVWLIDTRTGRALAIGVLPPSGTGTTTTTYSLPAGEVTGYNAVDVSLQRPTDGARHSGDSVLRGVIG